MKWSLAGVNCSRGRLVALSASAALAVLLGTSLSVPAKAQFKKATRPQVLRPEGEAWKVIRKNCTACHGIDDYAFYALDRDGWKKLIESKHKPGDYTMTDADWAPLLDWTVSRFGPNTKPFPRTYVPPEITTFFSDPEAKRLLDRACTTCHGMDRIDKARYSEEGWRVLAVDMRERGAKISDEELERLVEWLGRVWGTNQDK